jgi:hypothetical protein
VTRTENFAHVYCTFNLRVISGVISWRAQLNRSVFRIHSFL